MIRAARRTVNCKVAAAGSPVKQDCRIKRLKSPAARLREEAMLTARKGTVMEGTDGLPHLGDWPVPASDQH